MEKGEEIVGGVSLSLSFSEGQICRADFTARGSNVSYPTRKFSKPG